MMTLTYIAAVVILLGLCIFFHELGHLLGGRMVGIKAKIFSIGYGKGFIKKKIGVTTYQLTLIPLGGYCQFYGEDPEETREGLGYEFLSAAPWRRMVVVVMGPVFNLLLGIFLFFIMNMSGYMTETNRVSVPDAIVNGEYVSPAYRAGLRDDDLIVNVNGRDVRSFSDIQHALFFAENGAVNVSAEREGRVLVFEVEPVQAGDSGVHTIGVAPAGKNSLVMNIAPDSPAERAGLRRMDEIHEVNGSPVKGNSDFIEKINTMAGSEVLLKVFRRGETLSVSVIPENRKVITLYGKGEKILDLSSTEVLEGLILESKLSVGGLAVKNLPEFYSLILDSAGRELDFDFGGDSLSASARFREIGLIGVYLGTAPEMVEVKYGFTESLYYSVISPYEFIAMQLKGLGMLISGKLDLRENLGGPIKIGKIAGEVLYERGVSDFILLMAKISIVLMIMNLLPIPIVDGGHLVFFLVEIIRGKPLSDRVMRRINSFGMVFLLTLAAFVIINDIVSIIK